MSFNLGNIDAGATPADKAAFLAPYHITMHSDLQKKLQFRDEVSSVWRSFEEVGDIEGTTIRQLQQFLKDTGFMPKSNVDGIYGYATQAAVRLFQEYIRTVEGDEGIGVPDGVAGKGTLGYMKAWKDKKTGTPEFVCEWGRASNQNPSAEYLQWLMLLGKAKSQFTESPSPLLQLIDNFPKPSDTKKVKDWDISPETVHLIGIRRNQEVDSLNRENDDLFILLIKGMVFKFWGSTDPNQKMAKDKAGNPTPVPFLIEGQHSYQFGWHKMSDAATIYRALRPATDGVLVYRAPAGVRVMRDEDVLLRGLDKNPNGTINIHWSGMGTDGSWSAGCQVMAGRSYINNRGNLVDCSKFAASTYKFLGTKMTRGAYNVFTDLVLSYAPLGVRTIAYTLGREKTLSLSNKEADYVKNEVARMKGGVQRI